VLEHRFTCNLGESFTWESRRIVPGGDYTKNPERHNRS
jgi:hypothetical protein